jgi:hypothetical protein
MGTQTQKGRLTLDHLGRKENGFSLFGGLPSVGKLSEPMRQSFDSYEVEHFESHRAQLVTKFPRMMEVGRREPMRPILWIAMLASGQVPFHDSPELWIEQESPSQAVEERGEPADCGHGEDAARSKDPTSLSQCLKAVRALGQVVKGPKEKDHVELIIFGNQVPRIAHFCRHAQRPQIAEDLVDVARRQVDNVNVVPFLREPRGMNAGGASDVQDASWRIWKVTVEDLLRSDQLELSQPGR